MNIALDGNIVFLLHFILWRKNVVLMALKNWGNVTKPYGISRPALRAQVLVKF